MNRRSRNSRKIPTVVAAKSIHRPKRRLGAATKDSKRIRKPKPVRSRPVEARVTREELRDALALLLRKPKSRVTDSLLKKYVRKIQRDATDVAEMVARYRKQRAEKLERIGVSGTADTARYQQAEDQVLSDLYEELQRARPRPTLILQRSVQYALDARQHIDATLTQIEVRATESGHEVCIYPPGQARMPSLPYPGEPVEDPFAVRLLSLVLRRPVDYAEVMEFIETRLPQVSRVPEKVVAPDPSIRIEGRVVFLNGRPFPVDDAGARFVKQLAAEPNNWLSKKDLARDELLKMTRVDRVYRKLEKPIQDLIESKPGAGYRIVPARLA